MECIIGRQAIIDRYGKTYGYELLYRGSETAGDIGGEVATNRVIVNTFINIGVEKVAGDGRLFINFTRDLIVERLFEALPPDRVVIEVLEDVAAEDEVIEALKDAKGAGYTIALDDFVFEHHLNRLVEIADIVKVDFLALSKDEIEKEVKKYARYPKIRLLAEKVENYEDYTFALSRGFHYFQGYFFQKPRLTIKKELSPHQGSVLRAMELSVKGDKEKLIELISGDVYLHSKILSFVNSPLFGLKRKIKSVREAVNLLGLRRVREWLNIMYVARLAEDKPNELVVLSTLRAKFMSLLSYKFSTDSENAYLAGMFSLMDSILDIPMEDVLKECNYLDEEVKNALLGKQNRYFDQLNLIVAIENQRTETVNEIMKKYGLNVDEINRSFFEAVEFAHTVYS